MDKLLIANRGEIACRIVRTAKRLGISTVAVYSDADVDALHVELADEAVCIGPPLPAQSYLDIDAIIATAKRTGAQAIHPGYGFLSENARFARACADADIIFVGPPVGAIEAMGSKSAAKAIMAKAGVPMLPGYHGDDQSDDRLRAAAEDVGYPVLLKAAAGGGGKGMRIVAGAGDFDAELAAARREAKGGFGDDTMLVEKYLGAPRHVELQVFADTHGNCVHLFDRDCSIQRRHQKIIEEAPAPGLSDPLRAAMAGAAVAAARAIDYVGAGTVEFLVDGDGFYFMEMNTRLQVEHPVTERITGVDLVEWQLRVADGEALPRAQEDITATGHAIEARVYAEDADGGFLPTSGRITALREPATNKNVRLDTGVRAGDSIGVYYDPMVAKLVAFGDDREQARRRLVAALDDYLIDGLVNNLGFLRRVVASAPFAAGDLDTGFITRHSDAIARPERDAAACIVAAQQLHRASLTDTAASVWSRAAGWRMNGANTVKIELDLDGRLEVELEFDRRGTGPISASLDGTRHAVALDTTGGSARISLDGHGQRFNALCDGDAGVIASTRGRWSFSRIAPDTGSDSEAAGDGALRAPMTGRVVSINVVTGDNVVAGQALMVLEAMKMEHTLAAPFAGTVDECRTAVDALVDGGSVLITLQPETE
ncbi:MAG: biotin carboxylase N-terminal domain-containing protein [Pseudomonadota bacterium]